VPGGLDALAANKKMMKLFVLMLFLIGPEVLPLLAQKQNTIKVRVQELTFLCQT
jgi:hypothetical protein